MGFSIIIPARYGSTRLEGKLLLDLGGKSVIQHVYERALESQAASVIIATDHNDIAQVARDFGARVVMTSDQHLSGTDRLHEVVEIEKLQDSDIVVNVQGDEPFIRPEDINLVAKELEKDEEISVATLASKANNREEMFSTSQVKVVLDAQQYALYFSRAPIPWDRAGFQDSPGTSGATYLRHIGLYAYRVDLLRRFVAWGSCFLEKQESLEQLRILWHGYRIKVALTDHDSAISGIDTLSDIEKARAYLKQASAKS